MKPKFPNWKSKIFDNSNSLITYEDLKTHPIGKRVQLQEKVFTTRLKDSDTGVLFYILEMKKGAVITKNHTDCVRDLVLFSGEARNTSGNYDLKLYRVHRVEKYETLSWYCNEDCTVYANHYNPNDNV